MAKPIEPTPILYGKEADKFMEMISEPATDEELEFMKKIIKRFENFNPLEID
ncbi:MAG: hypothetical protein LBM96_08445 [Methanobrevibacter sp.]|jgi:hypothetical protein|nr:hypothetical protein [Candidatus Methanoflexus mossambicus]